MGVTIALAPPSPHYYKTIKEGFISLVLTEQEYLTDERIRTLTATVDDQLAAVSLVRIEQRAMRLLYTVVAPACRKQGINNAIKAHAETLALAEGCTALIGHVRAGNDASKASLLRAGFQEVESCAGFYQNGERKIRFVKQLSNSATTALEE